MVWPDSDILVQFNVILRFGMFTALAIFSMLMLAAVPLFNDGDNDSDDPAPPDDDILRGTEAADLLVGDEDTTLIDAGAGDDSIVADTETEIDAGAGDDTIEAEGGNSINAGDGDDVITVGGESVVEGGAGDDLVNGQGGSTISGGDGNDTLLGATLLSTIDGGAGDDVIAAGPATLVTSGSGADTISLSAAFPVTADIFNAGPTAVTDYTAGQDLYQINGSYTALESGGFDLGTLSFVESPAGVEVRLSGMAIMALQGVALADVDRGDFVLDRPMV